MNAPGTRYVPGQHCPTTGQWRIYRPDGADSGAERQVDKGEPFPPIPHGYTYGTPDASHGGRPDDPHEEEQDGVG